MSRTTQGRIRRNNACNRLPTLSEIFNSIGHQDVVVSRFRILHDVFKVNLLAVEPHLTCSSIVEFFICLLSLIVTDLIMVVPLCRVRDPFTFKKRH
jgi:hypothetical protein